ncbi:hypothetical protein REPUB_Repub19eG0084100 [Reevesia pubescens]
MQHSCKSRDFFSNRFPKKSYKEALLVALPKVDSLHGSLHDRNFDSNDDVVTIIINESDGEWLKNCAIGALFDLDVLPSLQDNLWDLGLQISVTPMKGKMVLIKPENKEALKDFIKDELDIWKQWFLSLEFWTPSCILDERFTWVKVSGLPIHAWNFSK